MALQLKGKASMEIGKEKPSQEGFLFGHFALCGLAPPGAACSSFSRTVARKRSATLSAISSADGDGLALLSLAF